MLRASPTPASPLGLGVAVEMARLPGQPPPAGPAIHHPRLLRPPGAGPGATALAPPGLSPLGCDSITGGKGWMFSS